MKMITKKEQNELFNILHNLWLNRTSANVNVIEFRDDSIKRINEILKLDDSRIRNGGYYHK